MLMGFNGDCQKGIYKFGIFQEVWNLIRLFLIFVLDHLL